MTGTPEIKSAFNAIRAIDYTIILVRDWTAMRGFYENVLGFPIARELSQGWIEYRIGANTLALAQPKRLASDQLTPRGAASLQLAFKVGRNDVDRCAAELTSKASLSWSRRRTSPSGTGPCSSGTRTAICSKCTRRSNS